MLRTTLLKPSSLSPDLYSRWLELHSGIPGLESACFHPEFSVAIGEFRPDAEVAVLEEGNRLVGFFPFRRTGRRTGRPIGWRLSEFHGPIVEPNVHYCPIELLKACRLDEWAFDTMPATCVPMADWSIAHEHVAVVDLSGGYDGYEELLRASSDTLLSANRRKIRKIEREVGPLRFELHSQDPAVLATLMRWKSQQHQRTGVLDLFQFSWFCELMERLYHTSADGFAGRLSVLFAGDCLVSAHLGLQSRMVRHMWYDSYDVELSRYSPGIMSRLALFRELATHGVQRVDLGGRDFEYKQRLKTGSQITCEGCVSRSGVRRALSRTWINGRDWARNSFLRRPAAGVARWVRSYRARQAFK